MFLKIQIGAVRGSRLRTSRVVESARCVRTLQQALLRVALTLVGVYCKQGRWEQHLWKVATSATSCERLLVSKP